MCENTLTFSWGLKLSHIRILKEIETVENAERQATEQKCPNCDGYQTA